MALDEGAKSGKKGVEAKGISKSFGDKVILKPFDLRILRGDRLAFVGPNGVGKTTLIKMLTGLEAPDEGSVKLGTGLEMAIFDQNRAALDPNASLWDTLAGDAEIGVSGKADQVMVRGVPKHVVGYLKEFLFTDAQARAPVIETLDLLQEILGDYPGTVLLVSHDRDFIDRVASTTIAMEGDGRAIAYAGGWSDYRAQRGVSEASAVSERKVKSAPQAAKKEEKSGLSFTEKHRLESLPAEIERLEAEIAKLTELMSDPDLFTQQPVKFQKASDALVARNTALSDAEEEWLMLEEKASA